MSLRNETGSGSVLMIGVVALVLSTGSAAVSISAAFAVKQRTAHAADAAALAAADTATGMVAGFPCEAAEKAARLNGADLGGCEIEGHIARVIARGQYLGIEVAVQARAGPARDGPSGSGPEVGWAR